MWERTLSDLIRGLRANKGDESQFIAKAVNEIRMEVKSKDMDLKAAAVLKLIYVRHYKLLVLILLLILMGKVGHARTPNALGFVLCGRGYV